MSKFIHNKSTSNVSLIDGKLLINIGGKRAITDLEAQHEDTIHALRLGWITIEGDKSESASPEAGPAIEFTKDEMLGSETIPTITKKEAAISSTIGGATGSTIDDSTGEVITAKNLRK
jgi:hypothetical protein